MLMILKNVTINSMYMSTSEFAPVESATAAELSKGGLRVATL